MKRILFSASLLFLFFTAVHSQSFLPFYKNGESELVPDFTLTPEGANGEYMFVKPAALCVDGQGTIYVLDQDDHNIKVFDRSGTFLRIIGREGQGPGEISVAVRMSLAPGNRIIVHDLSERRFSIFHTDGSFVKSFRLDARLRGFACGADGNAYILTREQAHRSGREASYSLIRLDESFKMKNTIKSVRFFDNKLVTGPRRMNVPLPFCPYFRFRLLSDGNIVAGITGEEEISVFSPEGKCLRSFPHNLTREKVSGKDKDAFFAGMVFYVNGQRAETPKFLKEAVEFPDKKPFYKELYTDQEGNLLAETYRTKGGKTMYRVFRPDGSHAADWYLPNPGTLPVFQNGHVYAINKTEDEMPVVVRYAVR